MTTVPASIPVMRWAVRRARYHDSDIEKRFPKWPLWLSGEVKPTLKQLEDFARLTHTAIGYFFLPQPPNVALPMSDFRTVRDEVFAEPSNNLLDTIYICQQRQDWFREYALSHGFKKLDFVGSADLSDDPVSVASAIRETLALSAEERRQFRTWEEALRQLIDKSEDSGILIMSNSIVGNNTHRKLDVGEFRGFVLVDDVTPLIFLNASDSKAARMFTLGHELAHVWLGESGVSNVEVGRVSEQNIERWCNSVAAELLMPMDALRNAQREEMPVSVEIQTLAREFKVSSLVALRRLFDAGFISEEALWQNYREEQTRLNDLNINKGKGGGDFNRTLGVRASKRFTRSLLNSTLEGETLFRDAFRMLGIKKTETFYSAAKEMGVTQ